MKTAFILLITVLTLTLSSRNTYAAACYSVANGNWNSASTWLSNGVPAVPGCSDVVYINHTVTVTAQLNYEACGTPMHLIVSSTLAFTAGNKLELPCNSSVTILVGGTVTKTTSGGGASTLISICNTNVWIANDGTQAGPLVWGTPPSGLPVEMISFTGNVNDQNITLAWEVGAEINNAYFRIERKNEGAEFREIGRVEGRINANTLFMYTFIDATPETGDNYYRLVQVDLDGTETTSDIIYVPFTSSGILLSSVYPNPVEDQLNLTLTTAEKEEITIQVVDLSGRLQQTQMVSLENGNNSVRLQTGQLLQGTYMIHISRNGAQDNISRLFVKK